MKSNVRISAGIVIIILGLLVIITPQYLFPVCEDSGGDSAVATSMGATVTTDDMGTGDAMAMEDDMGTMTTPTGTTTGTMTDEMNNMEDEMDEMNAEMDEMDMSASGGHAPCYFTSRGALLLGLLIMLAGVAIMLATTADAIRLLSLLLGGLGVAVILTPTYILPICENQQMQCHDGSQQLLIVLGALVIIVAAVLAAMAGKDRSGQA